MSSATCSECKITIPVVEGIISIPTIDEYCEKCIDRLIKEEQLVVDQLKVELNSLQDRVMDISVD